MVDTRIALEAIPLDNKSGNTGGWETITTNRVVVMNENNNV